MNKLVRAGACAWLGGCLAAAQSAVRPSAKAGDPHVVECRIVDRYGIPVPGVRVTGTSTYYGAFSRLAEAPFLARDVAGSATGADGRSRISVEPEERVWVSIAKEGYAPLTADGLFAGWQYELTLDLGCGAQLDFIGLTGDDLPIDTELYYSNGVRRLGPQFGELWGAEPLRVMQSAEFPVATFQRLGSGKYTAIARAPRKVAVAEFQVFSGFGVEMAVWQTLAPAPGISYRIAAIDQESKSTVANVVAVGSWSKQRASSLPLTIETDGTVCIPLLPVGSVGNVRIGAPGYESVSIDIFNRQDAPDQVVSLTTPLLRQSTRAVRFSVKDVEGAGPNTQVWCPRVLESRYAWPHWTQLQPDANGFYTAEGVPQSIETFGLLVRGGRIVRYISVVDSKLALTEPGSLRIAYDVEGVPVVGGLVHLKRRSATDGLKACSNLSLFSGIGMTTPAGEAMFAGLVAGEYDLELHEHYCVAEDWSTFGIALERGRQVARAVHVRRGSEVAGRVTEFDGKPVKGGTVQLKSEETRVYDQYFSVVDGAFTLLGIDPAKAYKVRYVGDETLSSRVQYGGSEEWTEFRLPIAGIIELKAGK